MTTSLHPLLVDPDVAAPQGVDAGDRTAATREKILRAARDSIIANGLGRTSMVEIARTAGVGRTTVYRHWKDLKTLLADLLTGMALEVLTDVNPRPASVEELCDTIADLAETVRASPLIEAIRRHEPELLAVYSYQRLGTSQRGFIELLTDALARIAESDPEMAGRDPRRTATILILTLQGTVLSSLLAADTVPDDQWRAELHRIAQGYLRP